MLNLKLSASILLAIVLVGNASARDLFDLSLEELSNVLVTGATLTANNLRDVPAAVTVFTRDDIRKLPVSSVEELMSFAPGFQAFRNSDYSGIDAASIRGLRSGYTNREMLVLLNGMKIDNNLIGGSSPVFANIPLTNLARVEFIRGPGSAIYGSGAYTGVVNLITDDGGRQLSASTGQYQTAKLSWQHSSAGTSDAPVRFTGLVEGTLDQGDDYTVPNSFTDGSVDSSDGYRQYNLQMQLWFGRDTRLQWVYQHNSADSFYIAGTVDDDFNEYQFQYSGLMLEQQLHWHSQIISQLQGGLQLSRLTHSFHPATAIDVGTISDPLSSDPLLFKPDVRNWEAWMRWQNDWAISYDNSMQFGLEYRQPRTERAQAANNYDIAQLAQGALPVNYYGDFSHVSSLAKESRQEVVGVYVQQQYRWSDTVKTIAGLRYDRYSQVGNAFSPRLGLILQPTSDDTFKLLWGRAFRAPQAEELYVVNNPILLGNPNLEPETVDTYELIWLHQWRTVQSSVNYFYNRFDNAIRTQANDSGRSYQNSRDTVTSNGVEIEITGQLGRNLRLHVTASKMIDVPDAFFRESSHWFSASGTYSTQNWYASMTMTYHGSKGNQISDDQRQSLDSFMLANMRFGWTLDSGLEPFLELRNLFDEQYATPANGNGIVDGVPGRGREGRLGIIWHY